MNIRERLRNTKPNSIGESECNCVTDKPVDNKINRNKLHTVTASWIYRKKRSVIGEVATVIDITFDSSGIDLVNVWS
jgi:hypothetical protein